MSVIAGIKSRIVIRVMALVVISLGYASASAAGLDERRPDLSGSLAGSATMYRGDAARSGAPPGPGPKAKPQELWQVVWDHWVFSSPIVADGVAYVNGGHYDTLFALDAASGEELWQFPTGGSDSPPAVVDGVVYVGASLNDAKSGALYALDAATGAEIWSFATPFPVYESAPAVVDGVVYVGCQEVDERFGALHAIDAKTGEEIWTVEREAPIVSSPAVVDGVVYVGGGGILSETGAVYAVDSATGEEVSTFATDDGDPVMTTPAVADGTVYAAGFWAFYAIDAKTGTSVWTLYDEEIFFDVSPAVADGIVYLGGSYLQALDAATGKTLWTYTSTEFLLSSPVLVDDVLYAGTYDNEIVAVSAADGEEQWRFQVEVEGDADDRTIDNSLAVVDGVIYFTSYDMDATQAQGAIHAIGLPE